MILRPSFSRWTVPVRFLGLGICALGLVQIFARSEPAGIVVAVIGAIIWQASALLEWWSPELRRLSRTRVSDWMRTERIDVPAWWKIAKLRERFPDLNERAFFVALQDGHELGIVLAGQVRNVSEDDARHLPVGQISRSVGYVDSLRDTDSLLAAWTEIRRRNRDWVIVRDGRGDIAGVVTREDLERQRHDIRSGPPALNDGVAHA